MTDFINQEYLSIISDLKKGHRPIRSLSEDQSNECLSHWNELNRKRAPLKEFLPLLCLLEHTKTGSLNYVAPIVETLSQRHEPDLLVHTLGCARKVIIEECERKGERIPFDFIKALRFPLKSKSPEVVEWALRTIDALGHQSIILKEDVLEARPGLFTLFNEHKKNSKELINYLEKRWGCFK